MSANDDLIKLPNGSWVRPSRVTAIRPLPETECCGEKIPPRVVVEHGSTGIEIVDFKSIQGAQGWAGHLAQKCNGGEDAPLKEPDPSLPDDVWASELHGDGGAR